MTDTVPQTDPARIEANGIELVYDTFGAPDAPPILLIMELGHQMIDCIAAITRHADPVRA